MARLRDLHKVIIALSDRPTCVTHVLYALFKWRLTIRKDADACSSLALTLLSLANNGLRSRGGDPHGTQISCCTHIPITFSNAPHSCICLESSYLLESSERSQRNLSRRLWLVSDFVPSRKILATRRPENIETIFQNQKIRRPQQVNNDNFCLHLWELWMSHPKYPFHCGKHKRDKHNQDVASDLSLSCKCCP